MSTASMPMPPIFELCPKAPDWRLDWAAIDATFPWIRALAGCPQNPKYHAEGDVWIHTRMVCEAMVAMDTWRALEPALREELFAAALLHDTAKPECTKVTADGRITSRGHARRGEILARRILWSQGVGIARRERICGLVRHHMVPLYLRDSERRERQVLGVSQTIRCDHLGILGRADANGRICEDHEDLLARHDAYGEICRDLGCFEHPFPFPSTDVRFRYFRTRDGLPNPGELPAEPNPEDGPEILLMSGLPGSGKAEWVRRNAPDLEAVSMDHLRREMGIGLFDNQGAVVARARDRARELLRRREPFVWNDANLTRASRDHLITLFAEGGARLRLVYVERDEANLRDRRRQDALPDHDLDQLLDRWEVPDLTEAHRIEFVTPDADPAPLPPTPQTVATAPEPEAVTEPG